MSKIAKCKEALPLPALMQLVGDGTRCKTQAKCPFHEDSSPSFSCWRSQGKWRWKCHSGCGTGDELDYVKLKFGLNTRQAVAAYSEMAESGNVAGTSVKPIQLEPSTPTPYTRPSCVSASDPLLNTLSRNRPYGLEGLKWARDEGVLHFVSWHRTLCYGISDSMDFGMELRKLDGTPFDALMQPDGSQHLAARKSHTIKGSVKNWPVGLPNACNVNTIVICEGIPDFLECYDRIIQEGKLQDLQMMPDMLPVCMLGASLKIHWDALAWFYEKRVRIMAHSDKVGVAAAIRWWHQLSKIASKVDIFSFYGLPFHDLYDARNHKERILPW